MVELGVEIRSLKNKQHDRVSMQGITSHRQSKPEWGQLAWTQSPHSVRRVAGTEGWPISGIRAQDG